MGNQEFCRHYLVSNITKSYRDIWLIDAWFQLQYVNVTINTIQYSWIRDTLMQPRAFVQLEVPCCGCCSRLRARFYRLEGEVLASDPPEFQNALYWMAHPQHYPRRSGKCHRMPDEMTGFFMKVFFSVRSWISFKEDEVWWWAMTGDGCKKWICKWRCYDTSFLCLIRTAVLALVLTFDFNVIQEGWWMPSQDRLYNSSWWQPTTRRFQRQPLILKPREWEIRYREEIGRLKAPGLIQRTQNSTVFSICLWNSLEHPWNYSDLGSFARESLNLVYKIDFHRSNIETESDLKPRWSSNPWSTCRCFLFTWNHGRLWESSIN